MTFQNEEDIARSVLDGKAPLWKKCSRCGEEWSKLTPTGECPVCNPDYMNPPRLADKPTEKTSFKSELGANTEIGDIPPGRTTGCHKCRNAGTVPMMDWQGAVYSFACSCDAGKDLTSMARWNGQEWQLHRGKKYRILEQYRGAI